jgi:hypothetical protein
MASDIASKAKIPNPALKPFERLIGHWRTTGAHPGVPNTILHGRVSFAWLEGGAFLVWRSQVDHPLFPSGISIFGSDGEAGTVFLSYFDERGISRRYDVTVDDDGFIMRRADPKFAQRMTYRMGVGSQRIIAKGEMSRDGGPWEDDLALTDERE